MDLSGNYQKLKREKKRRLIEDEDDRMGPQTNFYKHFH